MLMSPANQTKASQSLALMLTQTAIFHKKRKERVRP